MAYYEKYTNCNAFSKQSFWIPESIGTARQAVLSGQLQLFVSIVGTYCWIYVIAQLLNYYIFNVHAPFSFQWTFPCQSPKLPTD